MARKAIVIGAGITGIATAWALSEKGYSVTLLEKNAQLGGFAASFKHKNYILDYGPHKIYSTLPGIMNKYKEILGDDCLVVKKKNSLRLLGKYLSFPPKIGQMAMDIPKMAILRCGLSFSYSLAQNTLTKKKVISYEDYFLKGFGMQAYKLLFEQYAWKVWGDPKTLSEELARKRTPVPSIFHLAKNVIFGTKDKPEVSADIFYYPKYGIGQVCDKLVDSIKRNGGTIKAEVDIIAINKEENKIKSVSYQDKQGKHEEKADIVVSTIHLSDLTALFHPALPKEIITASSNLKFRALVMVYVFVDKNKINMKDNWIFFPEKEFIFNRVSDHASFSAYTCPEGKTVITAEVTCNAEDDFYNSKPEEIYAKVIADLEKADIIKKNDVEEFIVRKARRVYPVYTIGFRIFLDKVIEHLSNIDNFYTLGRQGLFNYNNTDHCIDMALHLAEYIQNSGSKEDWKKKLEYFDSYRIVD